MTEKLCYSDTHLFDFDALLLSCRPAKKGFELILDRTAFFPGGGGQSADTGYIGDVRVSELRELELNGETVVVHCAEEPLKEGERYSCRVDAEQRLRRMQNHSGEHIVSGITHALFGYDNVGFHMGEDCVTLDFSGELGPEELERIETLANEAVRANLPVRAFFPDSGELETLEYRSKLDLIEGVRLVEIPGIDLCACCAPHVKRTGEIGLIKILSAERHRGGMRLELLCGMDALDYVRKMSENTEHISKRLSAKRLEIAPAVDKLMSDRELQAEKISKISAALVSARAGKTEPRRGNICLFEDIDDEQYIRELVNALMPKCGGIAAVFAGDDHQGYKYVMGSENLNLSAQSRAINAAINGRGGGRGGMIQGFARADRETIRLYFAARC